MQKKQTIKLMLQTAITAISFDVKINGKMLHVTCWHPSCLGGCHFETQTNHVYTGAYMTNLSTYRAVMQQ